jgi:outer membrane protein assembly factor BamB
MRIPSLTVGLLLLAVGGCHKPSEPAARKDGWYVSQPGYADARPALAGDRVIVGTGDGQVIARARATGDAVWATRITRGRIRGANFVAAAGVVVAPAVLHTTALDTETGAVLWTYEAPVDTVGGGPPNPGNVVGVHVDADSTAAFIPAWGGTIAAVDLRSGQVRWTWRPESGIPNRFGAQGVQVDGGTVFATIWHFVNSTGTHSEGWVVALDKESGRELWRTVLPARSTGVCIPGRPAVTGDRVVALMLTGELYGLERQTGRIVWSVPRWTPEPNALFNAVITSPVTAEGVVYADAGTGYLRAYQASDGKLLWRANYLGQFKSDATIVGSEIFAPDGMRLLIFDRRAGRLVAARTQPGQTSGGLFSASVTADSRRVYAPVNGAVWAFPR